MSITDQLQAVRAQITAPGAPFELADLPVGDRNYRIYRNAPATLADLIDHGRNFGDQEFLVYLDQRWTFTRFYAEVDALDLGARREDDVADELDALALQLRSGYGIGKGERVAIAMRNRPEWMVAYAAIILCGAVAVPLNSWGLREELVYGLADSTPKLIVCDAPRLAHIAADLTELGVRAIVSEAPAEGLPAGVSLYGDVIDAAAAMKPLPPAQIDPDDLAMIMYTSGTSSNAKGVMSTHRAMCQGIVMLSATCFQASVASTRFS